jgi:hypothetical protein
MPRPGWAPDPLMVGIRSPDGLVVGLAPATLEFWVRFPNERNQGKQAHPVLKYRVPQGSHSAPPPPFTQSPYPPRSLVRAGQTHPHRPRLVVSHSTCPPLSSSPHAHSFVIGPAVIKHTHNKHTHTHFFVHSLFVLGPAVINTHTHSRLVRDGQTSPHRLRLVVFR